MRSQVTFICNVVTTVGKTSLHLSQWCVVQAFIHATMWHNTEPSTLGVCYWASAFLLCCLCGPGLTYIITNTACDTSTCLPLLQTKHIEDIYHFVVRMIPVSTLVISALPIMDDVPEARTLTLGLGMVSIVWYVIAVGWKLERTSRHSDSYTEVNGNVLNEGGKTTQISNSVCTNAVFKCRITTHTDNTTLVGNEVIISILTCMGIRWCASSINLFIENWISSAVLAVIVLCYSVLIAVFKRLSYPETKSWCANNRDENETEKTLNTTKESELFSVIDLQGNHKQVSPTPSSKIDTIINIESKYATMPSVSEGDYSVRKKANTLQPECTSSVFSEEAPSNSSYYNNKPIAKTWLQSGIVFTWLYALVLGSSLGSICAMCLWMFTSPALFCRWSELDLDTHGSVIIVFFASGCLAATFLVTGKLCCNRTHSHHDTITKRKNKREICKSVLVQSLVNLFLCCVVLIGISLVIYSKRNFSFVGANLLCVSIPTLICRVLYAAYDVIVYCRHERRSRALRVIPGIVLFAGGFWILCFHLLTIMFINPQISTMVLGKIDLIQWIQVSLVLLPLVIGPIYKARLQMETRPRSTSNGPLLSSPSGHSERNMFENECRKRSKFQETTRKHICPRKRFEYARSSSSFVILAFTAIVLMVKFIPSNSNTPCNMISPTAVCNRTNPVGNIRVVSWNILLGHQMNGRSNLNEIAGFLNEYNPHFIGLQEANGLPAYWGGRDVFRYLQKSLSSCTEVTEGINPKRSWLGVGIISRIPIIKQWNEFLPEKKGARLPHYSVSKVTGEIGDGCAQINDFGSGNDVGHLTEVRKRRIHIYSLHAVYKNWTCPRSSNLSYQHMKFVHDNVALLPPEDPVIVLGDMNINPWEKELDVWFNSELGFKSALWPDRNNWESRRSINKSANCTEDSLDISNNKNNCKCSNEWSDPPRSTLLNRKAAVDHIFYRGLELLEARIVNKTGRISDHFPVIAEFALTPL